jgi:hypothetical protein
VDTTSSGVAGVQFVGPDGLPHAKIFLYPNEDRLSLDEWLQTGDPLFLDKANAPEALVIAGERALFRSVGAEGLPAAEAYVEHGSRVVFIAALTIDEFQRFTSEFRFLSP